MSSVEGPTRGEWVRAAGAVAARPRLWPTALRQIWRLAPRGWWRRPPFVPRPDPDYLRFRLETMYGGARPGFRAADVVAYLTWCRRFPDDRHRWRNPNREKPPPMPR